MTKEIELTRIMKLRINPEMFNLPEGMTLEQFGKECVDADDVESQFDSPLLVDAVSYHIVERDDTETLNDEDMERERLRYMVLDYILYNLFESYSRPIVIEQYNGVEPEELFIAEYKRWKGLDGQSLEKKVHEEYDVQMLKDWNQQDKRTFVEVKKQVDIFYNLVNRRRLKLTLSEQEVHLINEKYRCIALLEEYKRWFQCMTRDNVEATYGKSPEALFVASYLEWEQIKQMDVEQIFLQNYLGKASEWKLTYRDITELSLIEQVETLYTSMHGYIIINPSE
ncbi:hypothetical protein CN918_25540 [Priestia megaterium]|nr:hypothetical protein CN918_25540 [Priestia megaterium]